MPSYRRNGGSVTRSHLRVRVGGSTLGAGRRLRTPFVDPPPVVTGSMTYTSEPLGAGGWVTGLSISPDGNTRLARTDTMGAWRWDTPTDQWVACITGTSMPTGYKEMDTGKGVQAVVAGNTVAFMAYNDAIFKSVNGGVTWTLSSSATTTTAPNTGEQRWWNTRMAVDPADETRCLYGTLRNGLWYTTNSGTTWTQVPSSAVPIGSDGATTPGNSTYGIPCVAIDTAGNWYAAPYGSGLYRSTDHGTTWAKISTDSQFIIVAGMAAGPNGDVLIAGQTAAAETAANSVVYRLRSGTLTQITSGFTGPGNDRIWRSVAYDALNPGAVLVQGDGGYERRSSNYGDTFVESWNSFTSDTPDVPWLAAANGLNQRYFYRTVGGLAFDPVVSGRVWMSQGIGVWYCDVPTSLTADMVWSASSRGIEQLVVNDVFAPPGGPAFAVSWDRPVFLLGETTSPPIVSVAQPLDTPVGYGGTLAATLVRGYPNPITYAWSVVSKPAGSTGGTFGSPSAMSTSFIPDMAGAYTLRITGTNAAGTHSTDVNLTATTAVTGLALPGTSGNYLQTPDTPQLRVTGSLTLLIRASMSNWAPTTAVGLIGKYASSKAYLMWIDSGGVYVSLSSTANGSVGFNVGTLKAMTFPPGSAQWLRAVFDATARTVTIASSSDGVAWSTISVATSSTPVSIYPGTDPLQVGFSGSKAGYFNGRIYKAQVWDGATLVADFDATQVTRTGTRAPATYTGSAGLTWTPQGTGWDWS